MGKLLEKIISPTRTILGKIIIGGILLSTTLPTTKANIRSHFKYFSTPTNITAINTQLPSKKGLIFSEENTITSIRDTTPTKKPLPPDRINIEMYADKDNKTIRFRYLNYPPSINKRLSPSQQFYNENRANTHVYFIVPKKTKINNIEQKTLIVNSKHPNGSSIPTIKSKDNRLNELLRKHRLLFGNIINTSNEKRDELEDSIDTLINSMGTTTGEIIKFTKNGIKRILTEEEERRREKLKEKYGTTHQIIKMPFDQPDTSIYWHTQIGRNTKITLDNSELENSEKGYIEIPSLMFQQNNQGIIKNISLENLAYEFDMIEERIKNPIGGKWELVSWYRFDKQKPKGKLTSLTAIIDEEQISFEECSTGGRRNNKTFEIKNILFDKNHDRWYLDIGDSSFGGVMYEKGESFRIENPSLAYFNRGYYKREEAKESTPKDLKEIQGTWKASNDKYPSEEEMMNISQRAIIFYSQNNPKEKSERKIGTFLKKIDNTYLLSIINRGSSRKIFPVTILNDNTIRILTIGSETEYTRYANK